MSFHRCLLPGIWLLLAGVVAVLPEAAVPAADVKETGFVPLFNGQNLTGWKAYAGKQDNWGAESGILFTKGGGGGWLMTEKEYADFELRMEYRLPRAGNSGIALRAPLQGNPAYAGMEIQLLDEAGYGKEKLQPTQYTGSIYGVVPPSKDAGKPAGEWNEMRIVAKGPKIVIDLNGVQIVNANLDDHKNQAKAHPGLLRAKGYIGLQSYNYRVDFRRLRIKVLEEAK